MTRLHIGPAPGSAIREGVILRRGALPRPPDRVQAVWSPVTEALFEARVPFREQVLEQFTPAARRLVR